MNPRILLDLLTRTLEFLDEVERDTTLDPYYADKAEVLVEDIESFLGKLEIDSDGR